MKKNYNDRVVWITGASSGIGQELAREFARQGARLVVSARRAEKLEALAQELKANDVLALPLDVTDSAAVVKSVGRVEAKMGRIDVLVNNSGISQRAKTADAGLDVDRRVMEVNFFGAVALTKAVLPLMLKQGYGQLAVTTSIVGKFGFPLRSAYSASKHALQGFFDSLRAEYPQLDVSIIIPGRIQTEISVNALDKDGKAYGKMDAGQQEGLDAVVAARRIVGQIDRKSVV